MKTKITLIVVLCAGLFTAKAQVGQLPNPFFQTWTNPYTPDGWVTPEALYNTPLGLTMRDTVDKVYPAACSLKLRSDSIALDPARGVQPGIVSLGTGSVPNIALPPVFVGMPFTYRPDTIYYAHKFIPGASDTEGAMGFIRMTRAGVDIFEGPGGGLWKIDTATFWKLGAVLLTGAYLGSSNPDTLLVQFVASYGQPIKNAALHLNEVLFGYKTLPNAIQDFADKLNLTIYPNPASNVINIASEEDITGCKIVVTDLNGSIVAINTLEGQKSAIDVHMLASGTYVYRIADKSGNIFKQDRFTIVK